MKVKVISLPYIFQVLYVLCFTRPRYQVSVYRTIGPLVLLVLLDQRMYSENSKIIIRLDSFSMHILNILVIFRLISVFETTALLICQITVFSSVAPFARSYRITNEALIAETAVLPIFFHSTECFSCSERI